MSDDPDVSIVKNMLRIHRLLQRFNLTRNEAMTLFALSTLLALGTVVRHVQQRAQVVPPGAYEEIDRMFFEAAARLDSSRAAESSPDTAGVRERAECADGIEHAEEPCTASARRIDINRATAEELESLPRIGPRTAERIIDFRRTYGPFHQVEDLLQVRGIGAKTLEALRPGIYAGRDSL